MADPSSSLSASVSTPRLFACSKAKATARWVELDTSGRSCVLVSHQDQLLRVRTHRGEVGAQWIIVTRIKHHAGGLILVPQADVHQPRFYVLRLAGSGPLNRLRQLSALALGLLPYDPGVCLEAADWVRIEGDPSVPVQIDGEALGELPLEISIHPRRLKLIFPVR
jgi:diacylglycerol kinase (ATP)